jgi:hypothetical protein
MRRRGQSTAEYVALAGAVLAIGAVLGIATQADASWIAERVKEALLGERPQRRDDRWALSSERYGPLFRRYQPVLVLERDRWNEDFSVPVDPAVCRERWCAAYGIGDPVVFAHLTRKPGVTYLQYWFYYPDSQTSHAPIERLRGYHRDDWEGMIVRIPDGGEATARVTAHHGLAGSGPWWAEDPGWRPIGERPEVYRASGSHANGFKPHGIDAPLDLWNGELTRIDRFRVIPADTAASQRLRYATGITPPWRKALWRNPDQLGTG